MELFVERGYDETTVGDIAARAELTDRTFFRYFTDKREVLFSGSKDLERMILDHIAAAPRDVSALEILVAAYAAAGTWIEGSRPIEAIRARYLLVSKHVQLQERELIKLASLGTSTLKALVARGVPAPTASLTAELGISLFKLGFERWVTSRKRSAFAGHLHAALADLRSVAAAAPAVAAKKPARRA